MMISVHSLTISGSVSAEPGTSWEQVGTKSRAPTCPDPTAALKALRGWRLSAHTLVEGPFGTWVPGFSPHGAGVLVEAPRVDVAEQRYTSSNRAACMQLNKSVQWGWKPGIGPTCNDAKASRRPKVAAPFTAGSWC